MALAVVGLRWSFMKTIFRMVLALTVVAPALGQNWVLTSAPSTNWSCVASSADGNKLVAAVNGGLIYTSTNSGVAWMPTTAPSNAWASVACSADGSKVIAAASYDYGDGEIYRSADSGSSWELTGAPSTYWRSVASSADGIHLAAAGEDTSVSTNSGAIWTYLDPGGIPTFVLFPLVSSSADGRIVSIVETGFGGQDSQIYTLPSSAWKPLGKSPSFRGHCSSVAMSADGTGIAATINNADAFEAGLTNCAGILFTSSSLGATQITNCTSVSNWTSVATSSDGIRLASVASSGEIYTSTNGGVTWAPNIVTNASWSSVASSADGAKLIAVANGGGIYTWQTTPTPTLNINRSGSDLQISWLIPSMSFVLRQSADLSSTNWTTVASAPVLNLTNLQNQVTLSPPSHPTFYRLSSGAP